MLGPWSKEGLNCFANVSICTDDNPFMRAQPVAPIRCGVVQWNLFHPRPPGLHLDRHSAFQPGVSTFAVGQNCWGIGQQDWQRQLGEVKRQEVASGCQAEALEV